MKYLDKALAQNFVLLVFEERYGCGWTAIIAPNSFDAAWVEDKLTGSDIEAVDMQSYLGTAGIRFPVSAGRPDSASEAIASLNNVLSRNTDDMWEAWYPRVRAAYEAMRAAETSGRNNPYFLSTAQDAGRLITID